MADLSTPSHSEIRSQAIAKLKRAASLPRRQPVGGDGIQPRSGTQSPSRSSPMGDNPERNVVAHPSYGEYQETLTPERATHNFATGQHASPYTPHDLTAYTAALQPQSSASSALQLQSSTSSAHPTPSPSPTPSVVLGIGRSTPSPLPSLGELRQLHRANSAAGRLVAMKKLMGQDPPSPTAIQSAGSIGSTGMLETRSTPGRPLDFGMGSPSRRREGPPRTADDSDPSARLLQADENRVNARPRLERSYTVGNGGGEERRSVIGRRMMQRLGNRVAVERLADGVLSTETGSLGWKAMEVRPNLESQPPEAHHAFAASEVVLAPAISNDEPTTPLDSQRFYSIIQDDSPTDPSLSRARNEDRAQTSKNETLAAPLDYMHITGRAASRTSAVSGDDAFEYEVHLRRSLSEKERKGKMLIQTTPEKEKAGRLVEELEEERLVSPPLRNVEMLPDVGVEPKTGTDTFVTNENDDFLPPLAPFAYGPSQIPNLGHMPASSQSSVASNKSSPDPIARIPFMLGDSRPSRSGTRAGTGTARQESMASFPAEVGDGGDEGRASSAFISPREGELRRCNKNYNNDLMFGLACKSRIYR